MCFFGRYVHVPGPGLGMELGTDRPPHGEGDTRVTQRFLEVQKWTFSLMFPINCSEHHFFPIACLTALPCPNLSQNSAHRCLELEPEGSVGKSVESVLPFSHKRNRCKLMPPIGS